MEVTVFKKIRDKVGVSQSEFAKSIGLEQGSYSGLESGKKGSLTKQTALLLKLVYGVSMDYLYGLSEKMFENESSEIVSGGKIKLDISMDAKEVVIQALTEKIQRLESEIAELRRKYESSEERPAV